MNKRIRKKTHLGEFKELAFHVQLDIELELTPEALDVYVDRWLDFLESKGFTCSGGLGRKGWFLEVNVGLVPTAEANQITVLVWLNEHGPPHYPMIHREPLFDAWYD